MKSTVSVKFDAELIKKYGQHGPRYTSYPTAVQFHEGFKEADYRRQAEASNKQTPGSPLSLYVHIPFCHSLCYFCGCNKVITQHPERAAAYLERLYREIEMQSALFDDDRPLLQFHFGGGTPTYLTIEQLGDLMTHIGNNFRFSPLDEREFSIEIDPRTVTTDTVTGLKNIGLNRLSMGVQDFDPVVQEAVNRIQSVEDTLGIIRHAWDVGFESVSVDLIYGLPFQSVTSFETTLEQILSVSPDRLAIYSYAHLPQVFKAQRLIRAEDLPTDQEKLDILQHTIERLTGAGYVYIGMDHFARAGDSLVTAQQEGKLQRNFQGYSTHGGLDLIGLGQSSIGKVADCYSQSVKSVNEYMAHVDDGKLPVWRGIVLDDDDKLRRDVIGQIMCHGSMSYARFEQERGFSFCEYFGRELEGLDVLAEDGLITVDDDGFEVTPSGRLLIRAVAMVFDRYMQEQEPAKRFSRII